MGANIDSCMMSNNALDPGRIFLRNPAKFATATAPNDPLLRPSQGFWGTGKQGCLFQGNYDLTVKNEENKQFWGTGNIGIEIVLGIGLREHNAIMESWFWFRRNTVQYNLFSGEQRNSPHCVCVCVGGVHSKSPPPQICPSSFFYQNGPPPPLPLPPTAYRAIQPAFHDLWLEHVSFLL